VSREESSVTNFSQPQSAELVRKNAGIARSASNPYFH